MPGYSSIPLQNYYSVRTPRSSKSYLSLRKWARIIAELREFAAPRRAARRAPTRSSSRTTRCSLTSSMTARASLTLLSARTTRALFSRRLRGTPPISTRAPVWSQMTVSQMTASRARYLAGFPVPRRTISAWTALPTKSRRIRSAWWFAARTRSASASS